ncbi:agmatine deiminase family protein [Flavobacterium sp.]|uniref:agmatine deiminase family protein n=1 Tax=Flavobacterium sp. TaxID=239 RepID=UPI00286E3EAC|nr:agmatine deiminase family protein [Flavobacterium sp.]
MKLNVLNTRFLKYGFVSVVTVFLFSCKKESKVDETKTDLESVATTDVRFPAEFEPQESVWMGWPTYENKAGWSVEELHVQIWAALAPNLYLDIAVNPDNPEKEYVYDEQIERIKELMAKYKVPADKVRFHKIAHDDVWWRDMGPIFVVNKSNQLEVADFAFNGWGYEALDSEYSLAEEKIDENVAKESKLKINSSSMISEGGNREFNGKGTMMAVEVVEKQRNPKMTKPQMEAEYKRLLGVTNVIWLPYGRYDDDLTFKSKLPNEKGIKEIYTVITTGGHIDEHTRFASATKILYTEISEGESKKDPIAAENKRRMDANLKVLKSAKDQDGNSFELIAMPSAPGIIETLSPGDGVYDYLATNDSIIKQNPIPKDKPIKVILASSYLNFLISNKVVIAQKFWKPGAPESWKVLDKKAADILQKAFPDRKIITFDPRAINIGGGGIHCNTQQKPLIAK